MPTEFQKSLKLRLDWAEITTVQESIGARCRDGAPSVVQRRITGSGAWRSKLVVGAVLLLCALSVSATARGADVPSSPAVASISTPTGNTLTAFANGSVTGTGQTQLDHGALKQLSGSIVGMASTPSGGGYWLAASDGEVFGFGNAHLYGSAARVHLSQPIVGMASTPNGRGYWLVSSDGQVFAFGNAGLYGSAESIHLNKPIVGMATTPDGRGYWLVASDGGVFNAGDARFYGSAGSMHLSEPIVGMASSSDGCGYWLAASDGEVFGFGNASFHGSSATGDRVVAITALKGGEGYDLESSGGAQISEGTSPVASSAAGAMPISNPQGWHRVFYDNFAGSHLDPSKWTSYLGSAPNDPATNWTASSVSTGSSGLVLRAVKEPDGIWNAGGVSSKVGLSQTYGKYEVRMRIAAADGVSFDDLLVPTGSPGSSYVEFAQNTGGNRQLLLSTLESKSSADKVQFQNKEIKTNLTDWQTVGVQWSPGEIDYTLNGVPWYEIHGASVPDAPMHLDLKLQVWTCPQSNGPCIDSSTPKQVNMDIAWVVAYAQGNASADGSPAPTKDAAIPGGIAMPSVAPTGYRQVFSDNFAESSLNTAKWSAYSGHPGADPGDIWSPSHIAVGGHEMIMSAYKDPAFGNDWVTAGVSSTPGLKQTYGKYLVRFRMDAGVGVTYVALLWPLSNSSPPEIDFAEDNGQGDRTVANATLHFRQDAQDQIVTHSLSINLTQWHTLGVQWSAGKIEYTVDGEIWATVTGPEVPSVPMVLDLQTQVWPCGTIGETCPTSATPAHVNMDVAWVVAYARVKS
jgi:beta-glucanase (GH16 family)